MQLFFKKELNNLANLFVLHKRMSDDDRRPCNKRRRDFTPPMPNRATDDRQPLHPAERKRRQHLRAYFKMIHEVRNEVEQFESFINGIELELRNDFHDISPAYMIEKIKLFLNRMLRFGRCPLSGDAINEMTYINHCGHVFNKISLEQAEPQVKKCPICSKHVGYPF